MWQWFGFVGLMVELSGFLLMAWDLLPEFKQYRRGQVLRRFQSLFTPAWFEEQRANSEIERRPQAAVIDAVMFRLSVQDFEALLRDLGVDTRLPYPAIDSVFVEHLREAEQRISAAEARLHSRWRPPMRGAISIVVFGVVLQLIGALPEPLRDTVKLHLLPMLPR